MTTPLILVTIITESLLKDRILGILRKHGATGHTITNTHGEGSRGQRPTDWGGPNLKIESIVPESVAAAILDEVSDQYFEDHSVVVWTTPVHVVRGEKFVRTP